MDDIAYTVHTFKEAGRYVAPQAHELESGLHA
jgi:hypothetical protein